MEAVIGRALARRPEDRFPTATAMRAALLHAGADPSRASAVALAAATYTPGPSMGPVEERHLGPVDGAGLGPSFWSC